MRQPLPWLMSIALAGLVVACAQGTGDGVVDAHINGSGSGSADAHLTPFADAPTQSTQPDAFVDTTPDAFVDTTPDAGGALICLKTADCSSDSCCQAITGSSPPGFCVFKFLNPVCLP